MIVPIGADTRSGIHSEVARRRWTDKGFHRYSDMTEDVRKEAAVAEWAVALVLRLDWTCYNGPDPGFDFTMADGRTIEVKYTPHSRGRFYLREGVDFAADVGVLVAPAATAMAVKGWLPRDVFEARCKWSDLGRPDQPEVRVVENANLRPIETLRTS